MDKENASIAKLDEMLQKIIGGFEEKVSLEEQLHTPVVSKIRWDNLLHLRLIGNSYFQYSKNLERNGLGLGSYINDDGSWLLVILPDYLDPDCYLHYCGPKLQSLTIENSYVAAGYLKLGHLTGLTALRILNISGVRNVQGLENLEQLITLTLSQCSRLIALPGLENLTQLTKLDLSRCNSLAVLPRLEKLPKLISLNLSECSSLTQLPGLETLTRLTSLNLSGCDSLSELPGLEKLTQLTSLDLFGCHSLKELPGLEKLTRLTSLDLSWCNSLKELPELENLTQLTFLTLHTCKSLKELPEGIRHLQSLRRLVLWGLTLQDLPDWLPEIAESFDSGGSAEKTGRSKAIVYLCGTSVEAIPDMSIFDRPYEMVVKFFEERKAGRTQPLNEIKVVFLGDGEAGKSHTIARLMNDGGDPVDYVDSSTPGIVIKDREYTSAEGRTFRVHYWDFGGQEIMHSMHRIFLTGRTMYVVLLNARDDTQGDRAHYWLHNIQSFAPGAPVLLVLNKIDQNPKASVDERTLRARYPGLTQIVRLSALKFNLEDFNKAFTDVMLDEIKNTSYLDAQWPGSWIQVKERLENMNTHYILGNEYKKICQDCQVNDLQADLLHWFNDLGVSFCFCDKEDYTLKKHVILRPDWITNGLYIILFNECPGAKNGQIPHEAIYDLLERASFDRSIQCTLPEASYDKPGDVEYVLGVMRKFQLSLDSGDGNEFIPMLCKQDSSVDIHYYEKDTDLLEFCMDFEYLPDNLLHRLMVERYAELDKINAWRRGARFELKELGLSAVVVIDGKQLRFFIKHTKAMYRPNTYLTMLKANVDRIVARMGLTPPECILIYKHEGKTGTFDYEELLQAREDNEQAIYSKVWRRRIPIDDILKQSAPDILEDEMKLLNEIRRSCQSIQDEPIYRLVRNENGRGYVNGPGMEDLRNRRVRDDLLRMGFRIADQTQRGSSGAGVSVGELDMLVLSERGESWTIIEALRVSNGTKKPWNDHLDKLLNKYNSQGLPRLYLLTYVDAAPTSFASIWEGYQTHIAKFNPDPYTYSAKSLEDLNRPDDLLGIRVARCQYACGGNSITVYHIFARIPTQNE